MDITWTDSSAYAGTALSGTWSNTDHKLVITIDSSNSSLVIRTGAMHLIIEADTNDPWTRTNEIMYPNDPDYPL